jgi:hypothetical protein
MDNLTRRSLAAFAAIAGTANSGFVQNALNDAYIFRGVDITKVQPVVIR